MGKGLSDLTKDERIDFNRDLGVLFVLLGFLALCYITGGIMKISTSDDYSHVLPAGGGLYGPFAIDEDNTSVMIKVERLAGLKPFDWDALDIEILNENKGYMSSFGAEFWKETGRDSDGNWTAKQYDAELAYFFHKKGEYYLKTTASSNKKRVSDALYVIKIRQQIGSGEMFFSVGFWMLWICGAWAIWTFRRFEGEE